MVFYIVKKKSLHFHLLSNFPTFVQKSGCSLKKKKRSSALKFPNFRPKSGCSLKKKKEKVFTSICSQISQLSSKNQGVL